MCETETAPVDGKIWLQLLPRGLYDFGLDLGHIEFPKTLVFYLPKHWDKMTFHSQ